MVLEYLLLPFILYFLILLVLAIIFKSWKKAFMITSAMSFIFLIIFSYFAYHDFKIVRSLGNEQVWSFKIGNELKSAFIVKSGAQSPLDNQSFDDIYNLIKQNNPPHLNEKPETPIIVIDMSEMIKSLPETVDFENYNLKKEDILKGLDSEKNKDAVIALIFSYYLSTKGLAFIISLIKTKQIMIYPEIYSLSLIKYVPEKLIQDIIKGMDLIPAQT